MNPETPYEIDRLLLEKPYELLDANEHEFAMGECGSPERYTRLRGAALSASAAMKADKGAMPRSAKKDIMAAFDEKHGKEQKVFALWSRDRAWHKQPLVRFAAAAALVGVFFWVLPSSETGTSQIAENKTNEASKEVAAPASDTIGSREPESVSKAEPLAEPEPIEVKREAMPAPADLVAEVRTTEDASESDLEMAMEEPAENVVSPSAKSIAQNDEASWNYFSASEDRPYRQANSDMAEQVGQIQESARSQAPASASALGLEKISAKKSADSADAFSFKLSSRPYWRETHYTAW